ncbi:MAG: type I methionyl aminopeptidase [Parcubacteria group bacterium]|nr:type I methionyl aminopeptidase [Parcubacteria group bacterium]
MISIKSPEELACMREGGRKLALIMKQLQFMVRPGVTTKELDGAAKKLIVQSGAQVAFQGYHGFPGAICISVNEEIVHVVPSKRVFKDGDIITLDIGCIWKGFYLDMARTLRVGAVTPETRHLIDVTKKALRLGVKKATVGNTVGDIGETIQRFVEGQGYQVVRELCGHGIGKELHEDPKVANFGKRHEGETLKEGMVICIEPMVTQGHWKLKHMKDGHGFTTEDGSLSCHFEDTIAITKKGPEILTKVR